MKHITLLALVTVFLTGVVNAKIKPIRVEDSVVVISATGAESALLVWYVHEDGNNSLNSTIFWKKETVKATQEGLFTIPVELGKAKSGVKYRIVVVNHTDGAKYEFVSTVSNGKFGN